MSRSRFALSVLAFLALTPAIVHACLWDYDTLQMERSRFPSVLELITGKFLRHSPEFYEWRVQDRLRRLEAEPDNLALYDDLAVAYDKLDQYDKAVETILLSKRKKPQRYETLANLGTFYVHSGNMRKGLEYIEQAIAVNPDAHFGREKFQKYLVQYVIGLSKLSSDGKATLPLQRGGRLLEAGDTNFYAFVRQLDKKEGETSYEAHPAISGILGIMKFGHHDSPILLEALGDLLARPILSGTEDAKRLASRAYLKASYECKDAIAKAEYRELAKNILVMQRQGPGSDQPVTLAEVETSFTRELADADAWYADLRAKEVEWIRSGANPETEFDRLYQEQPTVASPEDETSGVAAWVRRPIVTTAVWVIFLLAMAGLGIIFLVMLIRRIVARSRRQAV
jgi:tetratricopeptide (TPR) repeat protein